MNAEELDVCFSELLSMVDRALALGVDRIPLFKPHFTEKTVKRAHENGIKCNVFFAYYAEEAKRYRAMGIDGILTNDPPSVKNALGEGEKRPCRTRPFYVSACPSPVRTAWSRRESVTPPPRGARSRTISSLSLSRRSAPGR